MLIRNYPLIRKALFVAVVCSLAFLFLQVTAVNLSAHGGSLYLPSDLPACAARVLTCTSPSSSTPNLDSASIKIDKSQGNYVSTKVAPFRYMPRDLSVEKGEGRVASTYNAMGETPCVNGSAGPFPCANIDLLSFIPLNDMGAREGNDVWGWTDPADGSEYVLMGLTNGTAFVNISDPANPVYLGTLPAEDGLSSPWRDIKVYKDHAFIVADDLLGKPRVHGMQIFDLMQLSVVPTQTLPITFAATAVYDGIHTAHNIAINEKSGYAYAVGSQDFDDEIETCKGGLHMIDISSPTEPSFAGCFGDDGYTHDAQCVIYQGPDSAYRGREICFNSNEDTLTIVDVTDKAKPVQLAEVDYFCGIGDAPNTCNPNVRGGRLYVHQGWLTGDQNFFIQNDEKDERGAISNTRTHLWNVQDLDNPIYMGDSLLATESFDHNLYVKDQYIYAANYSGGLRIMDATHITSTTLYQVAYFDTYPQDDAREYVSAWSNYPFFESGVVAVSTITEGLFILRPSLSRANIQDLYLPFVQQ